LAASISIIVANGSAQAGPAGAKSAKANVAATADAQGAKKQKPLPEVTPDGPLQAQYCQAVRDAAAEARFAYQSEKLEALAKEIDERLAKLRARTAELKEWMAKREEFKSKSTTQLVSIFAAMRPESASEQLTRIEPATAASILSKLEARAASAILNDMPSDKAAALASILAGAAQQDPPSSQ
jgi:flagellar motility protein MotE (MotC chaperone)